MEGKLPPWSRTIWPRICLGSSLHVASVPIGLRGKSWSVGWQSDDLPNPLAVWSLCLFTVGGGGGGGGGGALG